MIGETFRDWEDRLVELRDDEIEQAGREHLELIEARTPEEER